MKIIIEQIEDEPEDWAVEMAEAVRAIADLIDQGFYSGWENPPGWEWELHE